MRRASAPDAVGAGPSKTRVREVETRQQPALYTDMVRGLGNPGAQLQNRLADAAVEQAALFKHHLRKLLKLSASTASYEAELAAGRMPLSLGPANPRIRPYTGYDDFDKVVMDAAYDKYREFQQDVAALITQQKQAAIARLTAEIQELKTVKGPAALRAAFDTFVAGSSHAQDADLQTMLQHSIKLLDLEICAVDSRLREGAAVRESKLLAAVQRRTEQQQRRQQREQNAGTTAASLAAAAAAVGAAAAASAVAAAGLAPPTGSQGDEDMQDMAPNQEQQQQQQQERAAAQAAITPTQVAAALQAGITASITHLLQHGGLPMAPVTPARPQPRPKPRNKDQYRPQPQQQPRQQQRTYNRPGQQQQQRGRPQPAGQQQQQQQQPRRPNTNRPNGPAPRHQAQPGRSPPRQQQQQRRPATPGAAAGRINGGASYRRTYTGGNSGPQGRQHSH